MEQIRKESLATELFAIFYIQKKPVQFVFWLVLMCFITYTVLTPKVYRAEGSFLIKAKNTQRSPNALESFEARVEITEEDIYTEAEVLSSKAVLTKTAERIFKKNLIHVTVRNKNEQLIIAGLSQEIAAALTVDVFKKTRIVHPVILWKDPKDAEILLDTLMWVYLEERQDVQNSEESRDFLQNQVNVYSSEWKNKKLSILKLAEKYNAPDPNLELTNNLSLKKDYVTVMNELEQKRSFLKSNIETLEKMLTDGQNHIYSFLSNNVLASLVTSLGDVQKEKDQVEKIFLPKRVEVKSANEALKNSIKTIRDEVLLHLQQQKTELKATNEILISLTDKLKKLEQRNIDLKKISIQMEQLQMESSLTASSYDVFYKRRDESQLKGALQSNVAILSHAQTDLVAVKPERVRLIFLGLFLAVILSLTVAFILDVLDQTIKTPRDVENYLRSPVLFSIEDLKESHSKKQIYLFSSSNEK